MKASEIGEAIGDFLYLIFSSAVMGAALNVAYMAAYGEWRGRIFLALWLVMLVARMHMNRLAWLIRSGE